ncbi:MAG: hypothetical protein DRI54_01520 [Bacteroidetes bacterium]|nr:MAG: hypothetical protein DRI54_01520 [Bacteroidota bacterium]
MKIIWSFFFSIIISFPSFCQDNSIDTTLIEDNSRLVRNVVGFAPSKANQINGWAIGWSSSVDDFHADIDSIKINGLYTNIPVIQALIIGWMVPYAIGSIFNPKTYVSLYENINSFPEYYSGIDDSMNGVSISVFDFSDEFVVNGTQITLFYHDMAELNGFSLTIGGARYVSFDGVMISGILNNTNQGKGVQLGLINRTKNMRGIQIGLWNRIGKRGLPFINFSFRKDNVNRNRHKKV